MEEEIVIIEKISRKSVSTEEWEREWRHFLAGEEDDTGVTRSYARFRANIPSPDEDTYLCVHDDGSVCMDGKATQSNTIFQVAHVFIPHTNYYQIICKGGRCNNYILYVDQTNGERKLKARPYNKEVDSLNRGLNRPTPTLFKFEEVCDTNVYITTLGDQSYHFTVDSAEDGNNSTSSRVILRESPPVDISFELTVIKM
ncbi:uncharacterized protein LOC135480196 [Liolophura sinensis]|uniref:uncharacterized protein LOC135480196 n=1 Tax=Liolophura sinensis TaxID=3198878 RepID=UPI003159213E